MPPAHESFREELLDFAYGELGRRKARALRAHLERCADCRAELDRMIATRGALSSLGTESASPRGEAVLLAAAREAARELGRRPFFPSWVWGASVGAVTVAAVVAVSIQFAPARRSPDEQAGRVDLLARASAPEPPRSASEGEGAPHTGEVPTGKGAPAASAAVPARGHPPREGEEKARVAPENSLAIVGNASSPPSERSETASAAESRPAPPPPPSAARSKTSNDATGPRAERGETRAEGGVAAKSRAVAAAVAEDPIARRDRLNAADRLLRTTASFPGCLHETSRVVEQDEKGRVVKYTRRGSESGAPFQVELYYGEDGLLGAVRYRAEDGVHELRLGAAPPDALKAGIPPWALEPFRSAEAGPGAPPRCGS